MHNQFPGGKVEEVIKYFILKSISLKYYFVGVGVNPIKSNKRFFHNLFSHADGGIFRDIQSLKNTKVDKPSFQYSTDIVAAFPIVLKSDKSNSMRVNTKRVCIATRGKAVLSEKYHYYRKLCTWLTDQGYGIDYLVFEPSDIKLGKALLESGLEIELYSDKDVMISKIDESQIVISERFHGIVLSLIMRKKFVPIIYDFKTLYLLEMIDWNQNLLFYATDKNSHLKNFHISPVNEIISYIQELNYIDFEVFFDKYKEFSNKAFLMYVEYFKSFIQN